MAFANSGSQIPDSGGAFKVTVYSPYIVLNRTGLEIDVQSRGSKLFGTSTSSGQPLIDLGEEGGKVAPFLFSFPRDKGKKRASIKVGKSKFSSPQSFDAIGSTYSVALKAPDSPLEMTAGVSIEEGEGKVSEQPWMVFSNVRSTT
jgi:vacuolar protein sorting-associated protein 13A/C